MPRAPVSDLEGWPLSCSPFLLRWIQLFLLSLLVAYSSLILMNGESFLGTSYRSASQIFSPFSLAAQRQDSHREREKRLVSRSLHLASVPSIHSLAALQNTFSRISQNLAASMAGDLWPPQNSKLSHRARQSRSKVTDYFLANLRSQRITPRDAEHLTIMQFIEGRTSFFKKLKNS